MKATEEKEDADDEITAVFGREFRVVILTTAGIRCMATVRPRYTVDDLKAQIWTLTNIPSEEQTLVTDSQTLRTGDLSHLRPDQVITVHKVELTTAETTNFQPTAESRVLALDEDYLSVVGQTNQLSMSAKDDQSSQVCSEIDDGFVMRTMYDNACLWVAKNFSEQIGQMQLEANRFLGLSDYGMPHPGCQRFLNAVRNLRHHDVDFALHGTQLELMPQICHVGFDPTYRRSGVLGEYHCLASTLRIALEKSRGSNRVFLVAILKGKHCTFTEEFAIVDNPPLSSQITYQFPLMILTFNCKTTPPKLNFANACDCGKAIEKHTFDDSDLESVARNILRMQSSMKSSVNIAETKKLGKMGKLATVSTVVNPLAFVSSVTAPSLFQAVSSSSSSSSCAASKSSEQKLPSVNLDYTPVNLDSTPVFVHIALSSISYIKNILGKPDTVSTVENPSVPVTSAAPSQLQAVSSSSSSSSSSCSSPKPSLNPDCKPLFSTPQQFVNIAKSSIGHLVSVKQLADGQIALVGGRTAVKRAQVELDTYLPVIIPLNTPELKTYWALLSQPQSGQISRAEQWARTLNVSVHFVDSQGCRLVVVGSPDLQGAFFAKFMTVTAEPDYARLFLEASKSLPSETASKATPVVDEKTQLSAPASQSVYGELTLDLELEDWREGSKEKAACRAAILADLCKFYNLGTDRIQVHELVEGSVHFVFSITGAPSIGAVGPKNMTPQQLVQTLRDAINIPNGPIYQLPTLQYTNSNAGMTASDSLLYVQLATRAKSWATVNAGGKTLLFEDNPYIASLCPATQRFQNGLASLPGVTLDQCMFAWHGSSIKNYPPICHVGLDPAFRKIQAYGPGEYHSPNLTFSAGYAKNCPSLLVNAILPGAHTKICSKNIWRIINPKWGSPPKPATEIAFNLPMITATWSIDNVLPPALTQWVACSCPVPVPLAQVAEAKAVFAAPAAPGGPAQGQEYNLRMHPEQGTSRVWVELKDGASPPKKTVYANGALAGAAVLAMFNQKSQQGFNFQALNNLPYRWQYEINDQVDGKANGWYDMMSTVPGTQERIESVYQQWLYLSKATFIYLTRVPAGNKYKYDVSFCSMSQKNTSTKKVRAIRRV